MTHNQWSVCLIASGMVEANVRLQPWRYLHEVARQLGLLGYQVTVISDGLANGPASDQVRNVTVKRVPGVSMRRWRANRPLQRAVAQAKPDVVLWHTGLTSFLHEQPRFEPEVRVVGIFTSPIYNWHDISQLGFRKIVRGYRLSGNHIAGTLAPKWGLRSSLKRGTVRHLVVQTQTTAGRLRSLGIPGQAVTVIPPGVDDVWNTPPNEDPTSIREQWGFDMSDKVVLYFGSPAQLRGLHTLIRALEIARHRNASLKLVVLNRRRVDELVHEDAELRQLLTNPGIRQHVHVIGGYLAEETLVQHVAACDIVALPFELVPSDAPLSLLEAQALGKTIVTTSVACLPDLVSSGSAYLARPGDPVSLAMALLEASEKVRGRNKQAGCSTLSICERPRRTWTQLGEDWASLVEAL